MPAEGLSATDGNGTAGTAHLTGGPFAPILTIWLNQIVKGGAMASAKIDEKTILDAAAKIFTEKK